MSLKGIPDKMRSKDSKLDSKKKPLRINGQIYNSPFHQMDINYIIQRAKKDPRSLTSREILELQRLLGNKAVMRLLQADLTIGQPGDQYEQEADQVANQVASRSDIIQAAAPEDEEEVQMALLERIAKGDTSPQAFADLNRTLVDDEGKATDKVRIIKRSNGASPTVSTDATRDLRISKINGGSTQEQAVSPQLAQRIEQTKGQGNSLPDNIQRTMSQHLGYDFSKVRVKTDAEAADLSRQLGARAFTQGRDIWLGRGESINDTRLMAHELTHVVQQGAASRIDRKKGSSLNRASDVVAHLRGMVRGDKEDTRIYRDVVKQFNENHPADRLAFLQKQILGTTTDISHGAKPGSVRLGICGGGGGGGAGAGGAGGGGAVAAPPTFPSSAEFRQDATVEAARAADWAAGEGDYAERFGWITWNATTHAYAVVGRVAGTWEGVTPGPKPADAAPVYHVGEYHQHPPLPPAEAPKTARYPVGPSDADESTSNADNSPGVVRDFTDTTRTTVCDYLYGPSRRT
jgi:hypothetical protein